jgi:DNA-binding XRE family transcriptional regulator
MPRSNKRPFRCNIRKHRQQLNMSGTELGQLIGIRHKEIYEIEHGRGITLTTAMRLAKALGVPIEKLWEFREQNEPSKSAAAIKANLSTQSQTSRGYVSDAIN